MHKDGAKQERVAGLIRSKEQGDLQIVVVEGKGRGVKATAPFKKGEYFCSYYGELLSKAEREKNYPDNVGCYLFFTHKGHDMWLSCFCSWCSMCTGLLYYTALM